jgi:hypothetical protein
VSSAAAIVDVFRADFPKITKEGPKAKVFLKSIIHSFVSLHDFLEILSVAA